MWLLSAVGGWDFGFLYTMMLGLYLRPYYPRQDKERRSLALVSALHLNAQAV